MSHRHLIALFRKDPLLGGGESSGVDATTSLRRLHDILVVCVIFETQLRVDHCV